MIGDMKTEITLAVNDWEEFQRREAG
jgi:hypothetical protein